MDKERAIREAALAKILKEEEAKRDPNLQEIVLLRTKLEVRTWFLRVVIAIAVAEAAIIFNLVY